MNLYLICKNLTITVTKLLVFLSDINYFLRFFEIKNKFRHLTVKD